MSDPNCLAAVLASLILDDADTDITADNISALTRAAGADLSPEWPRVTIEPRPLAYAVTHQK